LGGEPILSQPQEGECANTGQDTYAPTGAQE
jgi:hypothetical protein